MRMLRFSSLKSMIAVGDLPIEKPCGKFLTSRSALWRCPVTGVDGLPVMFVVTIVDDSHQCLKLWIWDMFQDMRSDNRRAKGSEQFFEQFSARFFGLVWNCEAWSFKAGINTWSWRTVWWCCGILISLPVINVAAFQLYIPLSRRGGTIALQWQWSEDDLAFSSDLRTQNMRTSNSVGQMSRRKSPQIVLFLSSCRIGHALRHSPKARPETDGIFVWQIIGDDDWV